MQNEYLFKKLAQIYVSPPKNLSKSKENKLEPEPPIMRNTKRKWDLLKITQENTSLTKRLIESKTSYNYRSPTSDLGMSRTKFNFKPKQKTKSSLSGKDKEKRGDEINLDSEFEELKSRTNQNFFGVTGFSSGERMTRRNFTAGMGFYRFENRLDLDADMRNTKVIENTNNRLIILDSPFKDKKKEKNLKSNNSFNPLNPEKKILYKRKAFLPKLSLVNIEFYAQYKKLFLLIEPISIYSGKLFMIIFEKIDDLHLLKFAYKNYENIINDLEFDGQNVLIKNEKSDLVYVREIYFYF
jgi:hypothetical protein